MSIYIPEHDTAFIHIPKTGGTSVLRWMKDNFEFEDRGDKHLDYKQYISKYEVPLNYFVCVRNPYARLLSWFHYMGTQANYHINIGQPRPWDNRARRAYKKGFKVWVREAINNPTGDIWSVNILKNQVDWFDHTNVKFVLKTETLNKDFVQVQEFLNCYTELDHLNKTIHSHYRDQYDYEMKLVVQKWFEKDLDTFKYTF